MGTPITHSHMQMRKNRSLHWMKAPVPDVNNSFNARNDSVSQCLHLVGVTESISVEELEHMVPFRICCVFLLIVNPSY